MNTAKDLVDKAVGAGVRRFRAICVLLGATVLAADGVTRTPLFANIENLYYSGSGNFIGTWRQSSGKGQGTFNGRKQ